MYFGAAKNLPNVQEVFKKEIPQAPQMNKQDLQRRIDPDYLGIDCFDDKDLEKSEKELEKKLLQKHNKDF